MISESKRKRFQTPPAAAEHYLICCLETWNLLNCSLNSKLVSALATPLRTGHGVEAIPLSLHQFMESDFRHFASVWTVEPIKQSSTFVWDFPDVILEYSNLWASLFLCRVSVGLQVISMRPVGGQPAWASKSRHDKYWLSHTLSSAELIKVSTVYFFFQQVPS